MVCWGFFSLPVELMGGGPAAPPIPRRTRTSTQVNPVPEQALMTPRNYNNWPSIFWRLFSCHPPPKQRLSFNHHSYHGPRSPSSLTLHLRLRIGPFTTNKANKALSPLHRDRALLSPCFPSWGVRDGLRRFRVNPGLVFTSLLVVLVQEMGLG